MMHLQVVFLVLAASLTGANAQLGWGRRGHYYTGDLAQKLLNRNASMMVQKILPEVNGKLSAIASWADEVRDQYPWSFNLHFINVPTWQCDYDREENCHGKDPVRDKDVCVDMAIQNYTNQVANLGPDNAKDWAVALKFLVHFIGDIHQPLHVSFGADEGGNKIRGTFFHNQTNLHSMWDTKMIQKKINDKYGGVPQAYLDYLTQQMKKREVFFEAWEDCESDDPFNACSEEWANESVELACGYSYVEADGLTHIKNGFYLKTFYYERNMPIIEEQLMKGAVRMANVLNSIWPEKRD